MKTYALTSIILIVIGIIAFVYQGITSYATREKVVDLGLIQMSAEQMKTLPLPLIVGGIVLLVMGSKKR